MSLSGSEKRTSVVRHDISVQHVERSEESEHEPEVLTAKVVLVFLAVNFAALTQLIVLVGSGAYARNIALVVGGSDISVWLSQSLAIFTCVLSPIVSQAADFWGRKPFLVGLTLCAVVGSIIVSRATTMEMAIAGDCVSGIAFGCQPLIYAVSSEILPRKYRPAAQGIANIAVAGGALFGLLVGSALVKASMEGFRTYFYITAGASALSAVVVFFLYDPQPRPLQKSLTFKEKLQRLDWVAYVLLATGIVLFSMALTWSDNPFPWTDAHIIAPFVVGSLLLVLLGLYSTFIKRDGLVHHDLFKKDRNFAIAIFCLFIEGITFFAGNNFFPEEMAIIFETDQLRVGLRYSITFFAAIPASVLVGLFATKTRRLREPTVVAYICFVIFDVLMATAHMDYGTALWVYPIFLGAGLGLCITCLITAGQLSTPPELIAVTTGLMIGVRSLGGSVALPIFNAILNSMLSKNIGAGVAEAVLPLGLPKSSLGAFITALASDNIPAVEAVPGVTPQIISAGAYGLKQAFLLSFRWVWVTAGAFSLVAAIAACFIINPTQDFNENIDAPLQESHHVEESKAVV